MLVRNVSRKDGAESCDFYLEPVETSDIQISRKTPTEKEFMACKHQYMLPVAFSQYTREHESSFHLAAGYSAQSFVLQIPLRQACTKQPLPTYHQWRLKQGAPSDASKLRGDFKRFRVLGIDLSVFDITLISRSDKGRYMVRKNPKINPHSWIPSVGMGATKERGLVHLLLMFHHFIVNITMILTETNLAPALFNSTVYLTWSSE